MKAKMINSVDSYVAGEEYDLEEETALRFFALGYAALNEKQVLGDEEIARFFDDRHQTVVV